MNDWNSKVLSCKDYNFYQSHEWGQLKERQGWEVNRFDYGNAVCQCLSKKIFGINLVWIPGGPLGEPSILGRLLSKVTDYYKSRNRLNYIRLNCQVESYPELSEVFESNGFRSPPYHIATNLTCVADRDYLKNIDGHLSTNWRRNLKRSYRYGHDISIREDAQDIEEIYSIYEDAVRIKGFNRTITLQFLKDMSSFKLITFLIRGSSGRIILLYGDRAYDFLAGTTVEGRKNYSSYYLVYKMMQWCAENNMASFDFSGIDSIKSRGVYNFKKGTGAKVVDFIGEREKSSRFLSTLCNIVFYIRFCL